ncbi:MAG: formate/nitrite transporter family protein [Verrucomicrobiales bacterium]|nr:formate/nitrite transporter family protein [Verrucomicrobiales bacterium]
MDYVKPIEVVKTMLATAEAKISLSVKDLLLRGILSGAILGFATSLAFTATAQSGIPLVGAVLFPVGFVMIVLLGLELVTGSFAVVMLVGVKDPIQWSRVFVNLWWVFIGNLIGSLLYGVLLYVVLTDCGSELPTGIASKVIAAAEAKTNGYAAHGMAGLVTVTVKAILCNWMVCLGLVMGMTSRSTVGKIIAAWLPVLTFFAQGFEHSVVNMFVIPTGMLLGAKVSWLDWWIWNQIPVTIGNLIGGFLFTGLFLYWTYSPAKKEAEADVVAVTEDLAKM